MSEEMLEEATEAEASLLAAQLGTVAGALNTQGARLSFTFWNEHGALTLTGFLAQGPGGSTAAPVDDEETRDTLASVLVEYPRRHAGEVTLTLRREQARWVVDYSSSAAWRPLEARTLPLPLREFPEDTVRSSTEGLRPLLAALQVPTGGEARAELEALLEDGRVEGWRLRLFQLTRGGGRPRPVSPHLTQQAVRVLLPFTLGLGSRTVLLSLKLTHRSQDTQATGWVESAQVVRPPLPPETNAAFVAEYRAMHEFILWRWREEVKEGAEWAARRGVEELALWYAGGVLLKGGGYLLRWSGSVMRRALGLGGEAAAGWLRTALARLPGDKKREFEWLWAKVQMEGEHALTAQERTSLRGLMESVEQLVKTRLDTQAKKRLRDLAREYYLSLHPEFRQLLTEQGRLYPIHHRLPLEYAHLFPEADINASRNLAMVHVEVHQHINRAWTHFRQLRPAPTAEEVQRALAIIDAQFASWYQKVGRPSGAEAVLGDAEKAVLNALNQLFPR